MENKLNHFDQKGNAVMVDVSGKIPTSRTAVAKGKICVCQAVMDAVKQGNVKIGDVLGVARVAGNMAEIARLGKKMGAQMGCFAFIRVAALVRAFLLNCFYLRLSKETGFVCCPVSSASPDQRTSE